MPENIFEHNKLRSMLFSKSFGYAVRSVLYIASVQSKKRYVQLDEIAHNFIYLNNHAEIIKNAGKGKISFI